MLLEAATSLQKRNALHFSKQECQINQTTLVAFASRLVLIHTHIVDLEATGEVGVAWIAAVVAAYCQVEQKVVGLLHGVEAGAVLVDGFG